MTALSFDPALLNSTSEPFLFVARGRQENERASIPHSHSRGQLFGSTRGVLTVGVEESVWVVPTIHAVWLPPHHTHWGRARDGFDGWALYVTEALCRNLPPEPRAIRTSGLLREAMLRAADWPLAPLGEAERHIASVILDEIRSLPAAGIDLPMPQDSRLARIATALLDDPAAPCGLDAWAKWSGASARTVSRRFVSETGFTFTAWRQRARLMQSLEMLAEDLSITSIALDLGFSSASAFISLFRESFGETPAAYRKRL